MTPADVTISETTKVHIDDGDVRILRSAQERLVGRKMPLAEFAALRGWITPPLPRRQQRTVWQKLIHWLRFRRIK